MTGYLNPMVMRSILYLFLYNMHQLHHILFSQIQLYIYNLNNFWNELLSLIDRLIDEDFAGENMKEAYKVINNYDDLTKLLENNGQN